MQKQAGGEGVNFASIIAGIGIVVVLGGWLAWATGIGGKPLPSNFQRMTQTAGAMPTIDATMIAGQIEQTPFYYGVLPETPYPVQFGLSASDLMGAVPSPLDQIQATQTQMFVVSNLFPTPAPTRTLMPGECFIGHNDPCWQTYVEEGLSPEQYWNLWTPAVATVVPTLRTFVTWTPTPDVSALERQLQATLHVMAQSTALALTPPAHAEERPQLFSEDAPDAARWLTEMGWRVAVER